MSETLTKADLETAKNELVQAKEAVAPLATKVELADKPGRAEFKELRALVLRVISFVPERKQYARLLADMDLLISWY